MSTPEESVSAWLTGLRQQPGSVNALCSAERALAVVVEDGLEKSLGEALDKWVDQTDVDWIEQVSGEAEEHRQRLGLERNYPQLVRLYGRTTTVLPCTAIQVRVGGVPGPVETTMLWSERGQANSDPVALAISLAEFYPTIDVVPGDRPEVFHPGPLDRYHPERFATFHPGVRSMYSAARADGGRMAKGEFLQEELQRLQRTIIEDMNPLVMELPHDRMADMPRLGSAPAGQAGSLGAHLLMWVAAGRQIYDLPPELVQRFRQTDVDDVPLSLLKYPYDSMYLYWGPQPDLELEPGWLVDGAYVQSGVEGVLQMLVTAAPTDPSESAWWPVKGEPYYFQGFERDTLGMDVGTAVDTVLASELADLRQRAAAKGMDVDTLIHDAVASGDIDPTQVPLHVEDVSSRTAGQEIERLTRRHATYVAALKLVINGLCYLTAYPDDSAPEYPAGAPEHLIKATSSTDFKTAKSARGRLAELGYLPVHLCGRELMSQPHPNGGDHHVRAHWRRGHWRRQPYGEGRALRKLIWVMPMVVGATAEGEPLGHLYLVS
ncbi:MAG: hypothetical protein EPN74_01935 [Rhodanobacter sp.]|nr:MAG: hypothetical protein EPN74_01935 [Rhodanobacter sp.]